MNIIVGDVLEALANKDIEGLIHGCNCFCSFGAGIAKSIRNRFPIAYDRDCQTSFGDYNKLGTIDLVPITQGRFIINAYTQYKYGGQQVLVDYDALRLCLRKVNHNTLLTTRKLGLPIIGCGLAGGDWNVVKKIIDDELPHATVYVLQKDAERIGCYDHK